MVFRDNILTLLIFLPTVTAIGITLTQSRDVARKIALASTLLTLALSLLLLAFFDWNHGDAYSYFSDGGGVVQLVQDVVWIPAFNVHYKVGIDGLSFPLVVLTAFIFVLALIASWNVRKMTRGYLALLLVLETGILGTFLAVDFFLFYVFFEVSLLPMYFLIGVWGGPRKEYAAIKFFLYTLLGSIGLLIVLIGVHLCSREVFPAAGGGPAGTFDLIRLAGPAMRQYFNQPEHAAVARTFFLLAMLAFLVKIPAFPLHTWLPDAHVEAPTPVSMVLAAVLLKMGGYGIFRIAYPLFPAAAKYFWLLIAILGVVSIIYGALCAMSQTDFKRLVAYSSVSHMGFVVLGAAMMTPMSVNGAIFMMIAHGVTSAMLFFIVGIVTDRVHHREMGRMGGLAGPMPICAGFSTVAMFANLGLPGLCGFIGEFMVLVGSFGAAAGGSAIMTADPSARAAIYVLAIVASFGIVLAAGYTLWALQRVFLGKPRPEQAAVPEVTQREVIVLTPLAIMCILLGILPAVFVFAFTDHTVAALMTLFK